MDSSVDWRAIQQVCVQCVYSVCARCVCQHSGVVCTGCVCGAAVPVYGVCMYELLLARCV
jgi:hypothetical protein